VTDTEFEIVERLPTAEESTALRRCVGWRVLELQAVRQGLQHSLFGVCAEHDGAIIGSARVVGDGSTVFYVQEVIVRPEHQGRGIGLALMCRVMAYLEQQACTGAVVGLMSASGKEPFYERLGFWSRPTDGFGAGMTQFWKQMPGDWRKAQD
jgi:predicted N-acetyltransferase YhbS